MTLAPMQPAHSKKRQALMAALTVVAIGVALAAAPLGFLSGVGLHRLLQPQRSPAALSVSNR